MIRTKTDAVSPNVADRNGFKASDSMPLIPSWVDSANRSDSDFPLNNLPFGRYLATGNRVTPCTALGDCIVDLRTLEQTGLLSLDGLSDMFQASGFSRFMHAGPEVWQRMRDRLQEVFSQGSSLADQARATLTPMKEVSLTLPFDVTEFTDFYASRHHATNVGTMFRGVDNALPHAWLHMPIGYNGRASSVVASGTPVRRPFGQVKGPDDAGPGFAPSQRFDFELELGAVVGVPSARPLSVDEAFDHIFGYVLLNDWSARDIQAWEYQPLGPFQSKATATTLGAWVVTAAALAPFRAPTPDRKLPLLPHLQDTGPMLYDIDLQVDLTPQAGEQTVLTQTNYREMYYSAAQQLAHHTSSGCPMRTGDLLGSGTISGPSPDSLGSMLELSWGGTQPLTLNCSASRCFLEDGDTVRFRGAAQGDGYRVGFGECSGQVVAAA